jgi:hypothetical protein
MTGLQILETATVSSTSLPFKLHAPNDDKRFSPMIGIYGTIGSAILTLEYKAPDGNWYDVNGSSNLAVGLYELPKIKDLFLRLDYVAGGGSSISAVVYGGQ